MEYKGKLIVFEGLDGSGKSTQTKMLAGYLEKGGFEVVKVDFPQHGEPSCGLVDEYLRGKYGTAEQVGPYIASIFYAVDRYDASFKMKGWLKEGKILVVDRYLGSNIGHQGSKIKDKGERLKFIKWLYNLEYGLFKIPKPTATIFLKTDPSFSLKLANKITDQEKKERRRAYLGDETVQDIHEKDKSHLSNALGAYLQAIEEFPDDFKVVECLDGGRLISPQEVHQKVIKIIEKIV